MLSSSDRADFAQRGLLRLAAAIPSSDAAIMRERCWEFLVAAHGIERGRPDTWTVERPRNLQPLKRSGAFHAMATGPVRQALDDLLGAGGWPRPKTWGLPLVTFARPGVDWTVPAAGWHVDSHGPEHELPGVTVFAFLTPVAARGGGTVVLPGSHQLFNSHIAATGIWRPGEVKAALAAEHPWLRDLWSTDPDPGRLARYLDTGAVIDGSTVRVQELTGAPGDVILMHPRTLHAPAPNSRPTPRMMLVEIIRRHGQAGNHHPIGGEEIGGSNQRAVDGTGLGAHESRFAVGQGLRRRSGDGIVAGPARVRRPDARGRPPGAHCCEQWRAPPSYPVHPCRDPPDRPDVPVTTRC